jgi:hypothetical protein
MAIEFVVDDSHAFAKFEGAGGRLKERLVEALRPIEQAILDDAMQRAVAHFHTVGAKPGLYLAAFSGGVKETDRGVVAWVRNPNPLAHLLEYGFTISDLLIEANGVMAFDMQGVGTLYRSEVHRHETKVQAYPAIRPALADHVDEIRGALERAARA